MAWPAVSAIRQAKAGRGPKPSRRKASAVKRETPPTASSRVNAAHMAATRSPSADVAGRMRNGAVGGFIRVNGDFGARDHGEGREMRQIEPGRCRVAEERRYGFRSANLLDRR